MVPAVTEEARGQERIAYIALGVISVLGATLLLHCEPGPTDAGLPDGPSLPDAGFDGGRCGLCPPERPHCDEAEGLCVECEERDECSPPNFGCMNGRCVACEVNRDCPTLEAPECYFGTHTCRPCTGDDACLGRAAPHCIEGRCAP